MSMATRPQYSPEEAQKMYLDGLRRSGPSEAVVRVIDEIERESAAKVSKRAARQKTRRLRRASRTA